LAVEAGSHSLGSFDPISNVASIHHSAIQHATISLEIKLSIKASLSRGKGDSSIITETWYALSGSYNQHNFPVYVPLRPESSQSINMKT
jgi:hypothetical protein